MNLRRKFIGMVTGCALGALLGAYSKKASAGPQDDLFEYALQYIADIIIQYYAGTWYNNTKEQIGEWGQNNGEQTVEEENTFRYDFARFGDAINAVSKEIANRELIADTEPTPLNCVGGSSNELKVSAKAVLDSKVEQRARNRDVDIKDLNSDEKEMDSFDVNLSNEKDVIELSSRINDTVSLLMNGTGYTPDEIAKIDSFFGASIPELSQINSNGEGFKLDRLNAERATLIAQVNTAKSAIDYLIAKRAKSSFGAINADLDVVASNYRKNLGLSDFEILQINIDLYTKNRDLNSKVNGKEGYSSFVPVGILLCEMKAIENKLLTDINSVDLIASKLMAIQSLVGQQA